MLENITLNYLIVVDEYIDRLRDICFEIIKTDDSVKILSLLSESKELRSKIDELNEKIDSNLEATTAIKLSLN